MENRHSESQSASRPPDTSRRSLGAELRQVRQEKNITLRQVSDDTHISLRHIQNLEESRYRELPGGMYNRAFLRTYCVYLGLAPEEYLESLDRETAPVSEKVVKAKARAQQAPPSAPVHIPQIFIWASMLLISIVGLYFSRGWISDVFSPYFSNPPATRLPVPAPPTPAKPPEQQAPTAAQPAATAPDQTAQTAETAKPPGQSVDAAKEPVSEPGKQPPAGPPPGVIRLEFQGLQACWMSVASDGKTVYAGTLQKGEAPSFDAKERFDLVLGNAGGVSVRINGKPAKPLGKAGEVIRVTIDARNLADFLEKLSG